MPLYFLSNFFAISLFSYFYFSQPQPSPSSRSCVSAAPLQRTSSPFFRALVVGHRPLSAGKLVVHGKVNGDVVPAVRRFHRQRSEGLVVGRSGEYYAQQKDCFRDLRWLCSVVARQQASGLSLHRFWRDSSVGKRFSP